MDTNIKSLKPALVPEIPVVGPASCPACTEKDAEAGKRVLQGLMKGYSGPIPATGGI